MSLIGDVRSITTQMVDNIKAQEKKIQNHERDRENWSDVRFAERVQQLQAEMATIQREGLDAVTQRVEQYKETVFAADLLDGSKLTPDVNLLTGNFNLTNADLNAMLERSTGNRTMERLVCQYAQAHGNVLDRHFYTAEEKAEAAECLITYARSVTQRPNFFDMMNSDDYFKQVLPEAIQGE
ncbi:MAG: hypothetical protein VB071_09185 [Lawsonibacter sp.]|nr:hypothetical protein [Lawsonibacter sp.]